MIYHKAYDYSTALLHASQKLNTTEWYDDASLGNLTTPVKISVYYS